LVWFWLAILPFLILKQVKPFAYAVLLLISPHFTASCRRTLVDSGWALSDHLRPESSSQTGSVTWARLVYGSPWLPRQHAPQFELPSDPQVQYTHEIEWYFVNVQATNDTANHFITAGPSWDQVFARGPPGGHHWPMDAISRSLSALAWFTYRYYLNQSAARWFLRATEDVMINWTNLDHFITEADQKGDPTKEKIAFGNCVGANPVYPQGGTGYLFSRRLVSEIETTEKFIKFTEDLSWPEDVAMGIFLGKMGVSMHSLTTERMLGHEFMRDQFARVSRGEFDRLPECPTTPPGVNVCRHFLARVNALAIMHSRWGMPDMNERRAYALGMWRAPDSVMFYINDVEPSVCRKSSPWDLLIN
jgi:hypothetical protein